MSSGKKYIDFFYKKYRGRVAIGVGYNTDLSEIYPFVFMNAAEESIGIVALGTIDGETESVYIYHLAAFVSRRGDGSSILKELCREADRFQVCLQVSAISLPDGSGTGMDSSRLKRWYEKFGFEDRSRLLRLPRRAQS